MSQTSAMLHLVLSSIRPLARAVLVTLLVLACSIVSGTPARAGDLEWVRWTGADRYLTSATIAVNAFSPPVPAAYVASGGDFPDALAAGPAAAQGDGGPVLLDEPLQPGHRDGVSSEVSSTLSFLQPQRIVVVGGPAVISDAVVSVLAQRFDVPVQRAGGSDRYATSVAVADGAFPSTTDRVFIASGVTFADALAAGPAAGDAQAPLLLTLPDDVPDVVMAKLQALDPDEIVIVGGPAAVGAAAEAELRTVASNVLRRAGATRYETAVEVSNHLFGKIDGAFPTTTGAVYLATGENWPDGLSASAPGGLAHSTRFSRHAGPVLLVRPGCIPPATSAELARLAASFSPESSLPVRVLGGTAAVSDAVLVDHVVCG